MEHYIKLCALFLVIYDIVVILSEVEESRRTPTHPYRPNLSPKEARRSPIPAPPPSVQPPCSSLSLNLVKGVAENKYSNPIILNHLQPKQIWHTYPIKHAIMVLVMKQEKPRHTAGAFLVCYQDFTHNPNDFNILAVIIR
jgi:hypothetical protein